MKQLEKIISKKYCNCEIDFILTFISQYLFYKWIGLIIYSIHVNTLLYHL
jgi:hypothetical protein